MINEARTLLLNRDGVGFNGYVGEEYTSPAFHAVTLPSFLQNVRRVLFGQRPDWLMYHYRAYELMSMLHATELEEFVTDLDSRITYSFDNLSQVFASVFPFQRGLLGSTAVTGLNGTTAELSPTSNFDPPDVVGQCFQQWYIELTASQFHMTHQTSPRKLTLENSVFTDGLSQLVQLPESPLQFRTADAPGSEWLLESYAQPQRGLGDLEAAIGGLSGETMLELFRVAEPEGRQEPWQTFKNLWHEHDETPYRLGSVVLALIYHTHNIWNVG